MAVIIEGMQMPGSCRECEWRKKCPHWNRRSLWKEEYMRKRADDCHLKSVDGLIEKMQSCFITHGQVIEGEFFSDDAENYNLGLEKAIEIIREYCGEGNNG